MEMGKAAAEKGGIMKKLVICLVTIVFFAAPLYAEMAVPQQRVMEAAKPGGQQMQMKCPMMQMHEQRMVQGERQMPMMHGRQHMQGMMQMCPKMCPRTGQMMGHGMMARDMMQIMTDMIGMQQKMIRGLSPVEKKEMMKDAEKMIEKLEKMMTDMRGMMMHGMMEQPSPATSKEADSDETEKEAAPGTDPHKH